MGRRRNTTIMAEQPDRLFQFQDVHPKSGERILVTPKEEPAAHLPSTQIQRARERQLPLPEDAVVHAAGTRTLARWIEEKRELEAREFGEDPHAMEGDRFADFLRTHTLAAIVELGEMLKETKWKTWTTERRRPTHAEWRRALIEYADVMMFMANIAIVMRFTGEDIDRALDEKFAIITARQRSGTYTGHAEKCAECGR